MAAPIAAIVTLPDDSGNTGKKMRTQTRVVGGNTAHEHFYVQAPKRDYVGSYFATSGVLTVQAGAQAFNTAGFLWLHNPVGSAIEVAITRLQVITQLSTALVAVTTPRLQFSVCTISGTASGASITAQKKDTSHLSPVGSLRTAITGLTCTAEKPWLATFPVASATAVAYSAPGFWEWHEDDEDEYVILDAGMCLYFYQPDAGTASDTRKITVNMEWKEFNP